MKKIINRIVSSFALQSLVITLLIFLTFYKTLGFPFNANREIGWIIQLTGRDFTFTTLMQSHGFISYINYLIFKTSPTGWYFTGILLHIAATLMVVKFTAHLLKSRMKGFLGGILFGVSTVGQDVITIGSGYSMYSAQLFLFLLSLYFYMKFRDKNNRWYYCFSVLAFLPLIPIRDSAIFFLPIFICFDFIFYGSFFFFSLPILKRFFGIKKSLKIKSLLTFIVPMMPFIIITILFIYFRSSYGGSPYDYNDHRARLTAKLIEDKEYFTYLKYSIIGFFFYLSTHIIPYPFINFVKSILIDIFSWNFLTTYFTPVLGLIYYALEALILYSYKNTKKFKYLLFAFVFMTVSTLFYSVAITLTEGDFAQTFGYDEHRWRYAAFFGTVLFFVVIADDILRRFKKVSAFKLSLSLVVVYLLINVFLLWNIQDSKFNESLKYQKLFNSTMLRTFPSYSSNKIIYFFPISFQLRDYLEEWHNLIPDYYPGVKSVRNNWAYEEMGKVLLGIREKNFSLSDINFIDFDLDRGIINRTKEARNAIRGQKVSLLLTAPTIIPPLYKVKVKDSIHVEFPYEIILSLSANYQRDESKKGIPDKKFSSLIDYAKTRAEFIENMTVEVCNTSGKREMFDPSHLIDGNLGTRSVWHADCGPDWFVVDLGKEYPISGFIMRGLENDTLSPESYYYEVSSDKKNWDKVMEVKRNQGWEMMDEWPRTYKKRYIKVTVLTTQRGGFVQLDEAEPVHEDAKDVFALWTDRKELLRDLYGLFSNATSSQAQYAMNSGLNIGYARLSWTTNLTGVSDTITSYYFPFRVDGSNTSIEVPLYESEAYSWAGQFLRRNIETVQLDFTSFPGTIYLEDFRLVPKIPISK